jgi:3-isopropylmalate/(R)-2-methylmalate dehydratase small subunit
MSNTLEIKHIAGTAVPIEGNDIDTDRIIPARFLKEITFENMGNYLFHDERVTQDGQKTSHPLNLPKFKNASIMIVGNNFGCGSSREHAAQAVKRYGITALIGESYSEIFSGNCKNIGVPTLIVSPSIQKALTKMATTFPETPIHIDLETLTLTTSGNTYPLQLSPEWQTAFLNGTWNAIETLKANIDHIRQKDMELPY